MKLQVSFFFFVERRSQSNNHLTFGFQAAAFKFFGCELLSFFFSFLSNNNETKKKRKEARKLMCRHYFLSLVFSHGIDYHVYTSRVVVLYELVARF